MLDIGFRCYVKSVRKVLLNSEQSASSIQWLLKINYVTCFQIFKEYNEQ